MKRTTPRRHCMVVDNYYPDIRVEREARALVRRGHQVDVICLRNEGEPAVEHADGITIHRLPVRRQRGMSLKVQLREYVSFFLRATFLVTRRHLRRRYDVVQAHNVPIMAVPTMGESWHGNHHAFPSSARHGLYPGQIDLGYRFVQTLELIGLAWNVKLPSRLPPRPGITPVTARALDIAAPGQAELCRPRSD